MSDDDYEWGYAINPDGSRTPLAPPPNLIPEEEREYLIETPGLVMWTRRA